MATVRRPIGRVGRGVKNAASSANQVAARSLAPFSACLEVPGLTPAPRRRRTTPPLLSWLSKEKGLSLSLIFLHVY